MINSITDHKLILTLKLPVKVYKGYRVLSASSWL